MELAGRKALLTGATGGLGRAIAEALAARGADLLLSARKRRRPRGARRGAARRRPQGPARRPGRARRRREARRRGRRASTSSSPTPGCPAPGWLADFTPEQVTRALRVNLEAPMLMAQALFPAMVERGSGHLVFIASLSGKAASPAPRSTTRPSSACAASPSVCARTSARRGSASRWSPRASSATRGCSPMPAPKPPPGLGTGTPSRSAPRWCKAIERDKVEVAVAPAAAAGAGPHRRWPAPASAARAQSGPPGQKAAEGGRRPATRRRSASRPPAAAGDAAPHRMES